MHLFRYYIYLCSNDDLHNFKYICVIRNVLSFAFVNKKLQRESFFLNCGAVFA